MASSKAAGKAKAPPPVYVHFLGTSSVDFGSEIWLFDAAGGTHSRLLTSSLKMSNITKIFITHLHADHVLGVIPILTTIMSGISNTPEYLEKQRKLGINKPASINIFGPRGLRELLRMTIRITEVNLSGAYAVHELLEEGGVGSAGCGEVELGVNEAVGRDLVVDENGVWRDIVLQGSGKGGKGWGVHAGPIKHRVPALGYILHEPTPLLPLDTASLIPLLTSNAQVLSTASPPIRHPLSLLSYLTAIPSPQPYILPSGQTLYPPSPSGIPPRKIVIFGDCIGGTPNPFFEEMCKEASLLVHECTNGSIPSRISRGEKGRKVRVEGMEHSLIRMEEVVKGRKVGEELRELDRQPDRGGSSRGAKRDYPGRVEAEFQRDEEARARVQKKALSRGHCTPIEVGIFARKIKAKRLVVNHFSAMFPSPRYPSSSPYPSILSPISPFPCPTPWPITYSPDPPIPPHPLTSAELHLRVIMQSLADQINEIWNDTPDNTESQEEKDMDTEMEMGRGFFRLAVPARDFMVLRVPAHELDDSEKDEHRIAKDDIEMVMTSWAHNGGVWVREGSERRWVGIDPPPK